MSASVHVDDHWPAADCPVPGDDHDPGRFVLTNAVRYRSAAVTVPAPSTACSSPVTASVTPPTHGNHEVTSSVSLAVESTTHWSNTSGVTWDNFTTTSVTTTWQHRARGPFHGSDAIP